MRSALLVALPAFISWLVPGPQASGQTLLRWKLQPGESFTVQTRQQTESQVAFSGQSVTTKIDLAITLSWTVTGIEKDGISIVQTVERVEAKLESPTVGVVQYDSASTMRPSGQAREIADTIK